MHDYDIETNAKSSQRKRPEKPRLKKTRPVRKKYEGFVHEFLPQDCTVNKEYNLEVIRRLRFRQQLTKLWKNQSWILHHDNAPASMLVRQFFLPKTKP